MSAKRNGLGRNLSALLSASLQPVEPDNAIIALRLPITQLQPGQFQPRQTFNEAALQTLAASIKQQGLLQPIIVRLISSNQYEIIAGERRWRACHLAQIDEVPVIVRTVDDETALALALIENLQREDLNPIDEGRALLKLTETFSLTHQQVAELIGKSRTSVTNHLRLLNLDATVLAFLEQGKMDKGHAKALLALDVSEQRRIAEFVVLKELSVRDTEKLVKKALDTPKDIPQPIPLSLHLQSKVDHLAQFLQTPIYLKPSKNDKGNLVIPYSAETELEDLIQRIIGEKFVSGSDSEAI